MQRLFVQLSRVLEWLPLKLGISQRFVLQSHDADQPYWWDEDPGAEEKETEVWSQPL